MVIADVLNEMKSGSPPFQPFINCNAATYEEKKLSWNPVCIKKDALFYQFTTEKEGDCMVELLPDACLNVLFECDQNNPRALFSGTFLEPEQLQLKPNTTYFGFKPYSNLGLKKPNIHLRELVQAYVDFSEAFPHVEELVAALLEAKNFDQRIQAFNCFAQENLIDYDYSPNFVDYFTVMICTSKGSIMFNNIEQITGYTERYCREKFKDAYGVSPKQYSCIMRFQNVLKALASDNYHDQSSLAFDNGYFDQAHLIRDFKKYTQVSPEKFRKELRQSV